MFFSEVTLNAFKWLRAIFRQRQPENGTICHSLGALKMAQTNVQSILQSWERSLLLLLFFLTYKNTK